MKTKNQKLAYLFGILAGIAVGLTFANIIVHKTLFTVFGMFFLSISPICLTTKDWKE